MNTNFSYLDYKEENSIGVLTLNREDKLNALSHEVIAELRACLELLSTKKLKGLIFTGAGEKAFIAGADIAGMANMTAMEAEKFAFEGQQVTQMFEELHFPVIAAVNGFALGGGCEMALSCDFIFATKNAVFGLPEVSLGLIPGFGGTQRLAKVVGRNRAKELIYTGRKVKAEEALNIGLALALYENKEELIKASFETIEKMANNSPLAIGTVKAVINAGADLSIKEGLDIEKSAFGKIFESYDMKEGTKAFVEKRKANFKGE